MFLATGETAIHDIISKDLNEGIKKSGTGNLREALQSISGVFADNPVILESDASEVFRR